MIIWRRNDRTHGGRAEAYPRALSEDWFFFSSVLWYIVAEAFEGGKDCDRPPSSPFSFFPFLEGILCYISSSHWSWSSICWSCRSLLECLSYLPPSSFCCELQQTRWYCSGVISSLMRPDCQLRAFNAEVIASPEITPPPYPHSWPTVLVYLFGKPERAVCEDVPLSPSVTLVGRGQDCPRRCPPVAWTFLTHPRTFLPRRGPWAWYEMGRGCWILRPHSKQCTSKLCLVTWIWIWILKLWIWNALIPNL